jgi:hypothetical protein
LSRAQLGSIFVLGGRIMDISIRAATSDDIP